MKTCFINILLFILAISPALGQNVSPLFQVMSSSSLIDRPQLFRDMDNNIDSNLAKVQPGLNVDYFKDKMTLLRDNMFGDLDVLVDSTKVEDILTIRTRLGTSLTDSIRISLFYDAINVSQIRWEKGGEESFIIHLPRTGDNIYDSLVTNIDSIIAKEILFPAIQRGLEVLPTGSLRGVLLASVYHYFETVGIKNELIDSIESMIDRADTASIPSRYKDATKIARICIAYLNGIGSSEIQQVCP
ncbi:MAG TPA: hypothetical protein VKS81_09000, partial [Bacteroidota bacterium]|nr:hypothetical protein [Bacteroidota bacterium]